MRRAAAASGHGGAWRGVPAVAFKRERMPVFCGTCMVCILNRLINVDRSR